MTKLEGTCVDFSEEEVVVDEPSAAVLPLTTTTVAVVVATVAVAVAIVTVVMNVAITVATEAALRKRSMGDCGAAEAGGREEAARVRQTRQAVKRAHLLLDFF